MNFVKALWQVPLSLCSWLFFHGMKFILGRLYTISLSMMTREARTWKVFSAETISLPFVLPIIATKGPRWNTHAIILTCGPLEVTQTLSINAASAIASASSWSVIVYANPGYQTVASIESFRIPGAEPWHSVTLKPGKYSINARYYGWNNSAVAPQVRVDGVDTVPAVAVPFNSNDFYQHLDQRDSWFYRCLHYYIFHILRFSGALPDSFVRREFLPVGDPGNFFRYGFIRREQGLEIESRQELLEDYDVYLTIYNRSSFPTGSQTIREPLARTERARTDGFYLFRIRQKGPIARAYREDWMRVQTVTAQLSASGASR